MSSLAPGLSTYLTEVLGISRFGVSGRRKLKVIFVTDSAFSAEAKELFLKMTVAMKLAATEFVLCEGEVAADLSAQYIVFFSTAVGAIKQPPSDVYAGISHLQTDSPELLLKNSELKKKVWSDLQKVMREISIEAAPGSS
jgi:hypothetical protein